jgi:hypothetical protein
MQVKANSIKRCAPPLPSEPTHFKVNMQSKQVTGLLVYQEQLIPGKNFLSSYMLAMLVNLQRFYLLSGIVSIAKG